MALVSFSRIKEMLNQCAPGHQMELKTHNWFVYYNNATFPSLPKYPEIEEFIVRKMGRSLGITACLKKFFGW
jgi:hypothetical protein